MTTCAKAIEAFEEKTGDDAATSTKVMLCGQIPPIEKMDGALSKLQACEHLAISSNVIERITGIKALTNLKVLSISRNQVKKLDGIEDVAATLEQLWISYNLLDKLLRIESLTNLQVLYISNNKINNWTEVMRLTNCPKLEEVLLEANPLFEQYQARGDYRMQVLGRLQTIKKLDGVPCNEEEHRQAKDFMIAQQMLQRFGSIEQIFKKIDVDGDGSLSKKEMDTALRNLGFPYDDDELEAFFNSVDANHNGRIEYAELEKKFDIVSTASDTRG